MGWWEVSGHFSDHAGKVPPLLAAFSSLRMLLKQSIQWKVTKCKIQTFDFRNTPTGAVTRWMGWKKNHIKGTNLTYTPEFSNLWGSLKSFDSCSVCLSRFCHFPPFSELFVIMATCVGVKFTKLSLVVGCSTVDPSHLFLSVLDCHQLLHLSRIL